jgi:O-antigen ligase
MVILLSSQNIIVAFIGLIIVYHLFYSKLSKQMRLKNLIVLLILVLSLGFIGNIKDRLHKEYETIMTDSTVNDVISKENKTTFYNVSIKQAWTNTVFNQNDFFPGTAFRVYQFRIFLEMMNEDKIFWKGYGLNASYPIIEAKGEAYHVYQGDDSNNGYQKMNFHNQYVQNFADLGVWGFLLIVIMLFVNVKNAIKTKDFMHFAFAFLMISLFLTESFLWRQRGVVFFTMMYCLFNSVPKVQDVQNSSKAE